MEVAVLGVGRMGRHHARVYHGMPGVRLVAVVDGDPERRAAVADEWGCSACEDVARLLDRFPRLRAATVAVPTAAHCAVAEPLLARGVACLVEKPLAPDSAAARALAELAERRGVLLQVGHTERFNPAVQAVAAMGVRPRFIEVHRVSPMTFRSLDVGVVMDMMIHDLDIVLMLADALPVQVDAAGVAVLGAHEDVVNARLVFASGGVANLTASRLALKTERKMRVFSEDAYVSLDYQGRRGVVIRRRDNAPALAEVRSRLAAGADMSDLDYSALVQIDQLTMDGAEPGPDPLTAELASFVDAVAGRSTSQVDGRAGSAAIDVAERVVAAVREHRWEGLCSSPI